MKIINKSKEVEIDEIENWKDNPRDIKKPDLERLKKQIQTLGLYKPLICEKEGNKYITIGGNMRLKALKELKHEKVWITVIETKDEAERIKISISDNDRAGYYVENILAEQIKKLGKVDLSMYKLDIKMPDMDLQDILDRNIKSTEADDEIPETRKTNIKIGDMFQLGKHYLLCGDCTVEANVKRLMGGKKADMVFTDPPYGMKLDCDFTDMKGIAKGNKYKQVMNDEKDYKPEHVFRDFDYCKEIFLWGADYYAQEIPKRNEGCFFVWDKTEGGISPNSTYDKMFGSNFELCWSKAKHKRQIVRCLWKGIFGLSKEDSKKRLHPTQKPTKLCEFFLMEFIEKGDTVVDIFLGSGSTLIACEKTGRICYGMEIDPVYCQVIIDRWEKFTNKKAKKLNLKEGKNE